MSKLAKQLLRCLVVGRDCILSISIVPKLDSLTALTDANSPSPRLPANTFDAAFTVSAHSLVCSVLSWFTLPKILSSVVQRVVVPMVTLLFPNARKNLTVHVNHFIQTIGPPFSYGIETARIWLPVSVPIPLTEPREVFRINDGILPLRERNQSVGCIEWLRNRMPLYSALWHGVLHQRTLCNAAILA